MTGELTPFNNLNPMPSWRERRERRKDDRDRRDLVARAQTEIVATNLQGAVVQAQINVVEAIVHDSEAVSSSYARRWLDDVADERANLISLAGRLDPGFGPWAASNLETARGRSFLTGSAAIDAFRDTRIHEV